MLSVGLGVALVPGGHQVACTTQALQARPHPEPETVGKGRPPPTLMADTAANNAKLLFKVFVLLEVLSGAGAGAGMGSEAGLGPKSKAMEKTEPCV